MSVSASVSRTIVTDTDAVITYREFLRFGWGTGSQDNLKGDVNPSVPRPSTAVKPTSSRYSVLRNFCVDQNLEWETSVENEGCPARTRDEHPRKFPATAIDLCTVVTLYFTVTRYPRSLVFDESFRERETKTRAVPHRVWRDEKVRNDDS